MKGKINVKHLVSSKFKLTDVESIRRKLSNIGPYYGESLELECGILEETLVMALALGDLILKKGSYLIFDKSKIFGFISSSSFRIIRDIGTIFIRFQNYVIYYFDEDDGKNLKVKPVQRFYEIIKKD